MFDWGSSPTSLTMAKSWYNGGCFDNVFWPCKKLSSRDVKKVVVFDSYQTSTTKASEQKRCRLHSCNSAGVPIPSNKCAFVENEHNKQSFINLLGNYIQVHGITVIHAGDGDANVVIVFDSCTFGQKCSCYCRWYQHFRLSIMHQETFLWSWKRKSIILLLERCNMFLGNL